MALQVFSQDSTAEKKTQKNESKDERGRINGLRKIGGHSHDWDFNINIDEESLERNIEKSIEIAMKSFEVTLNNMDVHMRPIEIDLHRLNHMGPLDVKVPKIDLDIEPIILENIDINTRLHQRHFNFDDEDDNNDNNDNNKIFQKDSSSSSHDKHKQKNKSYQDEKSKGLKKLN